MKDEAWCKEIISKMETLGETRPLSNFGLGQVYMFLGDYGKAVIHYAKAIELREGFVVLAKDNIRVYGKQHLVPEILEVLKKVAPLKENKYWIHKKSWKQKPCMLLPVKQQKMVICILVNTEKIAVMLSRFASYES